MALGTNSIEPVSKVLKSVNSIEGKARLTEHLKTIPFPHYEPTHDPPGFLVRIEADGKRTVGRFVNRQFKRAKARRLVE